MINQLQTIKDTLIETSNKLMESISNEVDKANKIRDSILSNIPEQEKALEAIKKAFQIDSEYYDTEILAKKKEIESLNLRLSNLSETKKTIQSIDADISNKKKELEDIKKLLQDKHGEFGVINLKINDAYVSSNKELAELSKEIDAKKDELEKLRSIAIPTMDQLDARSKVLDNREKDLKIVENRLRELYKKNGLNFLI